MSRCCICDRNTDIDGDRIHLTYNKEEAGYVCEDCNYEIFSSVQELEEKDEEAHRASDASSKKL
jgi:hypothetical protein